MAVWSNVLPLNASHLSSLSWVRILSRTYAEVASDLELGGGFRRVLWFPPPGTTG